ncbi:hypothetical protein [Pararhodospirillum photometricum]|uniref:hypothetical protein n=1 Tax=Pararhodospirillum photometricum TaxID=1084 RepID=UPI0005A2EF96|nr:hypothetical protein [Pararhodospirillum photometricum]
MRYAALSTAMILGLLCAAGPAAAGADDAKWISQCLQDNASANVPVETITKYCSCMNSKMDDNETQSITQWEKTHPAEQKECDAVAGWK